VSAPPAEPARRVRAWLLVVPAITLALGLAVDRARGPAWLGYDYDPEYFYLFNGLNLLEGARPGFTGHPGTTLSLWAAGTVWLVHHAVPGPHPGGRAASVRADVVDRPELYLSVIALGLLGGLVVAIGALGHAALRLTGHLPAALLAQLTPLLSLATVQELGRATPEAGLMALAVGLAAAMLSAARHAARQAEPRARGPAILVGILTGLTVATKFTGLPAGLLALGAAGGWAARRIVLASALVTFLVAFSPGLPRTVTNARWLLQLALHRGPYRTGSTTVIDVVHLPVVLGGLLLAEPIYLGLLLAGALACIRPRAHRTLLLTAVIAESLQVAIAAKGHGVGRYLLPGPALIAVNAALLAPTALGRPAGHRLAAGRRMAAVALFIAVAAQAWRTATFAGHLAERRERQLALHALVETQPPDRVVLTFGAPSPALALFFGDLIMRGRYRAEIAARHGSRLVVVGRIRMDPSPPGSDRVFAFRSESAALLRLDGHPVPADEAAGWAREGGLAFLGPLDALPVRFTYERPRQWPVAPLDPRGARQPDRLAAWGETGLYRARLRPETGEAGPPRAEPPAAARR
jgi:hypothetical protein